MSTVTLKIKNEAQLMRAWRKFPQEMSNALADALKMSGVFLTGKVKEHITSGTDMWKSPIDTGALRRGIHPIFESGKTRIVPSSNTPYAGYVHDGTGRMKARPFFDITAMKEADAVQKMALDVINKTIKRIL